MSIKDNLLRIQEQIANAANRSGRRPEDITLIGVSKTHPAIAIHEAYQAGVRHFGENRVQEWEVKRVGTNNLAATWHLIGHLQSNKAPKAAKLFHTVDSVDDFALAQKLDRARAEANMSSKLRVLFEVRDGQLRLGRESQSIAREARASAAHGARAHMVGRSNRLAASGPRRSDVHPAVFRPVTLAFCRGRASTRRCFARRRGSSVFPPFARAARRAEDKTRPAASGLVHGDVARLRSGHRRGRDGSPRGHCAFW